MHPLVREAEAAQLRTDRPYFRPGDTVRVSVRIVEGNKERLQPFEGVVIGRQGSGVRETFTVRRVSFNVGMERIFPLHSPRVEDIKVIRRGRTRRAKLYYLRDLRGKKARLSERRVSQDKLAAEGAIEKRTLEGHLAAAEEIQRSIESANSEQNAAAEAAAAAEAQAEAQEAEAQAAEESPAEEEKKSE